MIPLYGAALTVAATIVGAAVPANLFGMPSSAQVMAQIIGPFMSVGVVFSTNKIVNALVGGAAGSSAPRSVPRPGRPWVNEEALVSIATDDFIRSSGNLAYVNTWLKLFALLLLLVCLLLGAAVSVKIVDDRTEHVVPIVINQAMGDAIPVDDRVVDATGEERSPVEARRFCEDFLTEALIGGLFISADGGRCLVPDLWLLQAEILDGARLLLLGYSCCTIEVAGQLLEPIFEDASIGKVGAIHAAPEKPAPLDRLWVTSIVAITPAEASFAAFERECSNA